jgi:hypothetical protein
LVLCVILTFRQLLTDVFSRNLCSISSDINME